MLQLSVAGAIGARGGFRQFTVHIRESWPMKCPGCDQPSLVETMAKGGLLVDVCKKCKGVWLDRGKVFLLSRKPKELERMLAPDTDEPVLSDRRCPRCEVNLQETSFLRKDLLVDRCPECEGYWFDAGELTKAMEADRHAFELETEDLAFSGPPDPLDTSFDASDSSRDERAHDRLRDLASGMLPLPNLLLRSASVVVLLYGILGLVLIALAELHVLPASLAVGIGLAIIILQFVFGPWLMDLALRWIYRFSWVPLDQLPSHLRDFVVRVTGEQNMKVPSFGLIHDGAPNAFTYGHHPNNMRIVISQGILDLLEPAEIEGVVAHEIGHGKNWDMLLMTVVQLVPLLLYFLYRTAMQMGNRGKDNAYRIVVAVGAYVLYIVSEYMVLWFSRCREYYADRFAGKVTGNPNALASALVKIGYGLAARGQSQPVEAGEATETEDKKSKGGKKSGVPSLDAIGALGIFDRKSAVAMVAASASVGYDTGGAAGGTATITPKVSKENLKSAMQWDLWNPWATFYELGSTHPLVAHRLQYLSDQAAFMGDEPYIVFDRRKPESYWDEFLVDVLVMFLPLVGLAVGMGIALALGLTGLAGSRAILSLIGLPVLGLGVGSFIKTLLMYRGDYFSPLSVAGLLHKVKVSNVRPVPARMRGTIIGRGVPGLIWSEDFVMRDATGILFLDYRQPLRIWEWLFGLFRAGEFAGKPVEAIGWFRRAPLPYLELKSITVDGVTRNSYARHARYLGAILLAIIGLGLIVAGFM
jgi:Zn-dependent protease with chaperone function/Zn-finger nucleic acid-binding protein